MWPSCVILGPGRPPLSRAVFRGEKSIAARRAWPRADLNAKYRGVDKHSYQPHECR